LLKSATPDPNAGFLESIPSHFYRAISGVSPQEVSDYKAMQRFQNQGVLAQQSTQKGPQTESDAVRMAMVGLSPDKPAALNARVIGDATLSGLIAQKRPDFYTKWVNRNGSLGALENGVSVDEAWAKKVSETQHGYNADPRIRRLDPTPGKQNGAAKFLGWEGE
jgi:hypothetical protein